MSTEATRAEIDLLERIGHLTWPAFEEEFIHEWLVRAANGVTRRSNSVNPGSAVPEDLSEAVNMSGAWLKRRNLPAIFRLTPLAPAGLEPLLVTRGYQRHDGTSIMVRAVEGQHPVAGVELSPTRSDEWMDVLAEQGDRGGSSRQTVEQLLDSHDSPTAFVLIRDRGIPISIGMAVVVDHHVGIFNMRTQDSHRRLGMGRQILGSLLAFGADQGAEVACLQVHPANSAAMGLYRSSGFMRRYDYWYYQPPD